MAEIHRTQVYGRVGGLRRHFLELATHQDLLRRTLCSEVKDGGVLGGLDVRRAVQVQLRLLFRSCGRLVHPEYLSACGGVLRLALHLKCGTAGTHHVVVESQFLYFFLGHSLIVLQTDVVDLGHLLKGLDLSQFHLLVVEVAGVH